ncbi:glycosyltransferase family 2 protein [Paraflavitalea speifideaquila]|uniref:glycosyltransferase family 2 protein n=1 Tax=Paraflavitalea speifideaquila TaxID=3076558 RepID=UPI0028EFDBFE|nr:glycosyltransferase [Paraflavitalea speifideiaquila]
MNRSISIIIITYNRPADCLELLKDISLLNYIQEALTDVIVINNASTVDYSDIKTFIEQNPHLPFRYKDAPSNLGVARGRNYAAGFAQGDLLVFVDDDVLLTDKDILPKIIASFDKKLSPDREVGAVSFKVLYHSNGEMQVTAFPHKQFNKYKDKSEFLTSYYVGCAHAIKKQVWLQAGDYPEDFFYGMEEYDLSYRILDAGYAIQYEASVVILHKESPLGRKPVAEKLKMQWVNKSKVAWRYLPKRYFYTTALLWSFEYLKKAGFRKGLYFSAWREIARIPGLKNAALFLTVPCLI